jgi:hypothetical protein
MHACQAAKDVSASYDALIDLLSSIEHFINHLNIYTRVPSMGVITEMIVKIMVEMISTLALVTKEIKEKRSSECVAMYLYTALVSMQDSETGKENVRSE